MSLYFDANKMVRKYLPKISSHTTLENFMIARVAFNNFFIFCSKKLVLYH